jgi:YD repeat-containing protein
MPSTGSAPTTTTHAAPTGAVTDYDYNLAGTPNAGTPATVTMPKGVATPPPVDDDYKWTFEAYDPSGKPTRIRDPLGNVTQFGYDPDGRLTFSQDPNHQGGPTGSGTDLRAYRTYFDYDSFGRLGRQSAPKSTAGERGRLIWSGVDYDLNDNVVRRVDPHYVQLRVPAGDPGAGDPEDGPFGTATYDDMDRPAVVADSDRTVDTLGERTTYRYDDAGRLSKITKPRGQFPWSPPAVLDDFTTELTHDPLDRVTRQTEYGTSTADKRITHSCYDLAGDLRSVTAPNAALDTVSCPVADTARFTTRYSYNDAHRLTAQRDPLGHETRTSHDKNSNITSVERDINTTSPVRVARTSYGYDMRDALTQVVDHFTGTRDITTQIQYDPNGNRSKLISPRAYDAATPAQRQSGDYTNYVTSLDYDQADQLVKTILPFDLGDDTNHNGTVDDTEKQYVHQAYDANGNLAWTSLPVAIPLAANVAATAKTTLDYYDPGWMRGSDDPVNPKVRFDYTAQGWQVERTPDQAGTPGEPDLGLRMRWVYDPDGQLAERRDQDGQLTRYDFDVDDNLKIALDAAGVTGPNQTPVDTQAFYTGFDQPSKVRTRAQGVANWTFSSYAYDRDGNTTERRENGQETDAESQTVAPRLYQFSYNDADWLTEQRDLGTTSACLNDQQILTTYWDTGWEKQRDLRRAATGCTANPASPTWPRKQTTKWEHFDNGKLQTLKTIAVRNNTDVTTESHDVGYTDNGIYLNGHQATDQYFLERRTGSGATTCLTIANPCDATYSYDARDRLISQQRRAGV